MKKNAKDSLVEIRDHLATRQKNISTRAVNLRELKVKDHNHFEIDGVELTIPANDHLPIKQLCQAIGMSAGFYESNPSVLNTRIFEERFNALEDDKAQRMIRLLKTDRGLQLLAILPMVHQAPTYVDVVEPLLELLPESTEIRLSNHESVDSDHRLSMRISLTDYPINMTKEDGSPENCDLGFFLDLSEDGAGGNMRMTSMLYNQMCTNGAMISYDSHPYLQYNYRGIRAVDLAAAVKSCIGRFGDDVSVIHKRVTDSGKTMFSKSQALGFLKGLESRREISLGFIRKVRKEIEGAEIEQISRWRVVNNMTFNAQKLPYDGRVQHEFVAGSLLGLDIHQQAA